MGLQEGIAEEESTAFDASRAIFRAFTFDDCGQVFAREVWLAIGLLAISSAWSALCLT